MRDVCKGLSSLSSSVLTCCNTRSGAFPGSLVIRLMEPFEISVSSTALSFSLTILFAIMGSPTLPVHLNDRNFSWPLANNWIKRKQKTKTDRCIKQYSLILKKSEQCSDLLSQVFSIYNKIKEAMV